MTGTLPPTPELDKLRAVQDESQVLGEFLTEWLPSQGIHLMMYVDGDDLPRMVNRTPNTLLAEFFGIDLVKVETERRAVLKYLREKS